MEQRKNETRYTYTDYASWQDDKRWELIDGVPHMMAPAPSSNHQEISANLMAILVNYLRGKSCKAFAAPYDVRLNANADDDTVVQPDISVICDKTKIDEKGCKGVPDMLVEILSPSTIKHDQITKFNKYREAGVREYWIIDPDIQCIFVHIWKNGNYFVQTYEETETVRVHVLEDCTVELAQVFPVLETPPEADAPATAGPPSV